MFGNNNKSDRGKRKGADLMNQLGFGPPPGIPGMGGMEYDDDDDDDLEAELAALAGEDYTPPARKAKPKKKAPLPMSEIQRMAAAGMEDFDEDVSDTEDPDLLSELQELQEEDDDENAPSPSKQPSPTKVASPISPSATPHCSNIPSHSTPSPSPRTLPSPTSHPPAPTSKPSPVPSPNRPKPSGAGGMVGLLEERISMYRQASARAKAAGEGAKQRRMDRGIKTLAEHLKHAKAGKQVNEEEIPPPVFTGSNEDFAPSASPSTSSASTPSPVASSAPATLGQAHAPVSGQAASSSGESTKYALSERRDQYRKAALMAKRGGDMPTAGKYVRISKQFDAMLQAVDEGKTVDLSQMPPVPPELAGGAHQTTQQPQPSALVQRAVTQGAGSKEEEEEDELPKTSLEEAKELFGAPESPKTAMEALTQRLAKYKESEAAAKTAGDGSKARRMGRIVKQFEEAIKCLKAGRPVDFEELPTPPGFGPIPVGNSSAPSPAPKAPATASKSPAPPPPSVAAATSHATAAAAPRPASAALTKSAAPPAPVQRQNTARRSTSRIDQQLAFLRERMGEFKDAAMKAKKNHDLELAKKYVRMYKGIEPMIEALECGLPVDLSQVPPSPLESEDTSFVVVNAEDCAPTGDREEVFKTLQEDLIRQIRICVTNAQHYQKLGDVPTTAKFQKLEQHSRKDLESLKSAYRHGDPAPKFHYEIRTFSMVQSNTDLGDADLEVTVERGIQYNLPSGYSEKDMDTCVKYELAYPSESPQSGGTGTVKDTVNPEYKETFKLEINRSSKTFFRFVERKALKFEVYIKRGFFKGDKLLGTVSIKLQPLESKCTLHDSFDLMDGRKTAGGKLEVKLRVRDPFKSKQVEEVKEKWLVIDQFIRTLASVGQLNPKQQGQRAESVGTVSMEVLRYEKQTLDKQIGQLKDSLSVIQTQNLRHKSAMLQEKIELQQKKLREGGIEAWRAYLAGVEKEAVELTQEARQHAKVGESKKAELYLTKKKYAEKEIAAIKARMTSAQ